jgi:hypothetical protein
VLRRHGRRIASAANAAIALLLVLGLPNAAAADPVPARPTVVVSPSPGSAHVSPSQPISFREIATSAIGAIRVTGSSSGSHGGTWTPHSDARGATFRPTVPFVPGEIVTLHTNLAVAPNGADTVAYVVDHPSPVERTADVDGIAPSGGRYASAIQAAADVASYTTRPDLEPPIMAVTGNGPTANGAFAVTPRNAPGKQLGALLLDNNGKPIWFKPVPSGLEAFDAGFQHYQGHQVLSWFEGVNLGGHGDGQYEVVDTSYKHVATIEADGFETDFHDMRITPQNTALTLSYHSVNLNLTPVGRPGTFPVIELVVQEIDIPTGAAMWTWKSLDDIPITKSVQALPANQSDAWDYIHGNSVDVDNDGNVIVSARHTSAVYKINRTTHELMWTLGKNGDFAAQNFGDWFWNQHDFRRRSDGTMSVFDNGNGQGRRSRGIVMNVDEAGKKVSYVRKVISPTPAASTSQGSFRELSGGHDVAGWGNIGELTEFDSTGQPVRDMTFPGSMQSYRAVKAEWHAAPAVGPTAIVDRIGSSVHAWVSWNGATEVRKCVLLAGVDANHLVSIGARLPTGFETDLVATTTLPMVALEARDANDHPLGRSAQAGTLGDVDHASYWLARQDGTVDRFGTATMHAGARVPGGHPIVGMATTPAGGYWLVSRDGSVYPYGNATSFGSLAGRPLAAPIVGMAALPDGRGYWLVGADGGVFSFGNARFYGSTGALRLAKPVVGIATLPDGRGYWLAGADGGVFSFGNARFYGSTGARQLRAPISGMTVTNQGNGYWLVGADGGVFTFGFAQFRGSLPTTSASPVVAIAHN